MTKEARPSKVGEIVDTMIHSSRFGDDVLDTTRKRDAWTRFAAAHDGEFGIKTTVDHTYMTFHLAIPFSDSQIVFVETDTRPLKLSFLVPSDDGFRFTIWPQDFADALMHFFGAQDVVIGDEEFDKAFVIKANDERRVKRLLESREIKSFLLAGRDLSIGTETSEGKTYLRMTANRTTETEPELNSLFSFFCTVIQRLHETGATP
ncbi:MAG: hypothetical protein M0R80_04615 [Proteobacteria bacterium]|jgi:hypothetical protein|nr:hypothetical protein [Pseudomonadota bacterium]